MSQNHSKPPKTSQNHPLLLRKHPLFFKTELKPAIKIIPGTL